MFKGWSTYLTFGAAEPRYRRNMSSVAGVSRTQARRPRAKAVGADHGIPLPIRRYAENSQRPLQSLVFVLPLLILHEIGVRQFGTSADGLVEYRVAAFSLLVRFFQGWGAYGHHLPALAVVAVLLGWHFARGDPWEVRLSHVLGMALESLLLAAPLLTVFLLTPSGASTYTPAGDWKLLASMYLGAGVYEEMLFRLLGFAILSLLLMDVARTPQAVAVPVIVSTAAAGFAAYHTLGSAAIPWQAFVFITLRGMYYGVLFLGRGFGVTVGVHVAYDMLHLSVSVGL